MVHDMCGLWMSQSKGQKASILRNSICNVASVHTECTDGHGPHTTWSRQPADKGLTSERPRGYLKMSRLDVVYRNLLPTRFFTKGWGNPESLGRLIEFRKRLSNRETCNDMVSKEHPIIIDKVETQKKIKMIEGHFKSPFVDQLPGLMPPEVETVRFQMILPLTWDSKWGSHLKPVCVHLAGTGDHGFNRRRRLLARPLVQQAGIASILLENPFYGSRKPKKQVRSMLHHVSDLFVMGGALVLESLALFHWCERQGYGPLGITGVSMGGFMASLAASSCKHPISLIPCLSWSTASTVFTEGVMSTAINWKLLQGQFNSERVYADEHSKLVCSPEENRKNEAFQLELAKNYPVSVDEMVYHQQQHFMDNTCTNSGTNPSGVVRPQSDHCTTNTNPSTKSSSMQFHTSASVLKSSLFTQPIPSSLNQLGRLLDPKRHAQKETVDFMRLVMDDFTHLGNFTCPLDPALIIIIVAKADAYIPRDSVLSLQDLWPGSQLRYVDGGHIGAFLTKQANFRDAIIDAFDVHIKKYYSSRSTEDLKKSL